METTVPIVKRTLVVEAAQERAFHVFTAEFDSWWPRSHHTGEGDLLEATIEPAAGGRWFARTTVGEEDWGRVLVWEPPYRVVLDWQLNADFEYDSEFHTEVEARFAAESPDRTRVEFEHLNIDRYGDRAAEMAAALGSDGGWTGILSAYATAGAARRGD
jgi:Activator of Hsp90 ATPase homolog 1-like protein